MVLRVGNPVLTQKLVSGDPKSTTFMNISKSTRSSFAKMRVFFFKRHVWPILIAVCIFIGCNIVLFRKFMSRKMIERKKGQQLAMEYLQHNLVKPSSKLSNVVDFISTNQKDDPSKGILDPKIDKTGENPSNGKELERQLVTIGTTRLEDANTVKDGHKLTTTTRDSKAQNYNFVVLVIACNRPTVKRCLDQLIKYRPSKEKFPIVVSQDCGHANTAAVIKSYGDQVKHIQQPDLGNVQGVPNNMVHFMGYYKISRHFKWALGQVFDKMNYGTVIIVEDDLDIAPDFFEYFTATRPLLSRDPTLWCVSAWNDNGKQEMVKGSDLLYRTDFFSGLGWMLTKNVWDELRSKWPLGFWDDWMRNPAQRKERACIRPEICRTKTFGKVGVSKGQFYDQHLKYIKLNDQSFPFTESDLSYLMKDNYDSQFWHKVNSIPTITLSQLQSSSSDLGEVNVEYSSNTNFEHVARTLGAMSDFKAGIARVSYQGVVTFMYRRTRVYLSPKH